MKLTPREGATAAVAAALDEATFFSCPDAYGDPQRSLREVQNEADRQNLGVDYALATDLEYFAVRGARAWLLTEPDDQHGTSTFKLALLRAGLVDHATDIIGVIQDGSQVQIVTEKGRTTIDTVAGTLTTCDHAAATARGLPVPTN